MVPEYIGYADQSVTRGMFTARRAKVEHVGPHRFKYRLDLDALDIGRDVAALCVSRPTNPTANVLTDDELRKLSALAKRRGAYLIVDNAYGAPFPNILFRDTKPVFGEHVINSFSLSKLGLPGTRTGIIVASKEIVRRVAGMNAVSILATNSIGQALTEPLFASDDILRLGRDVIQPYYLERQRFILQCIEESFPPDLDYHVHECEGAFFLWLWLRGLPIHVRELYERLKRRKVLVLAGHFFFPGYDEPWRHKQECLRLSYVQPPDVVRRGVRILADEVRKAYGRRPR
jgi:valine--pyruvate aminotransferase